MVQLLRRNTTDEPSVVPEEPGPRATQTELIEPIPIPDGDPLEAVLLSSSGPVEVSGLDLESEAMRRVRSAGVELMVPLVGQGELLGVLYLGPRLSDQPYSTDDRRLMENLASQVAPAIKVAQLVRQQQVETEERERIQQEMRVAALIQQTLLPRELPSIAGWTIDAFYRPARAVGGDFYDFIDLEDGRLGVVIGDVTDKGVPAAMVMATCRSMLRAAAHAHTSPGAVLADVNESLVPEIPPAMFVTCLYAIVDTTGGEVVFANAGHNLPYVRRSDGVSELRATGMPLGLMPDMDYEEHTYRTAPGEVMVLTSDGITEAHDPDGEMYGFSRLMGRVGGQVSQDMCSHLVADLERFTGPDAEQEDDITLVVLQRTSSAEASADVLAKGRSRNVLTKFSVPSVEGNERTAIDRVSETVAGLGLDPGQVERLQTAVGESVMNAMEHGNQYQPDLPVDVEVADSGTSVVVRVTDGGEGPEISEAVTTPDLEAKIAGEQSPRGWGLFLIGQMVDEMRTENGEGTHTVELLINKEGAGQ